MAVEAYVELEKLEQPFGRLSFAGGIEDTAAAVVVVAAAAARGVGGRGTNSQGQGLPSCELQGRPVGILGGLKDIQKETCPPLPTGLSAPSSGGQRTRLPATDDEEEGEAKDDEKYVEDEQLFFDLEADDDDSFLVAAATAAAAAEEAVAVGPLEVRQDRG